jgi:alpha-galactosidase
MRLFTLVAATLASLVLAVRPACAAGPAPTPPMGWNSWDAYGLTIDEAQFKANARVLAKLKSYGWTYAVVDEGWYMADPFAQGREARRYLIDGQGRLEPVLQRFPSAADGRGLAALAAWTHAQGLKFGIHIVRGVPKGAVERDLPIEGSRFRAKDAADAAATCPWDDGNYGVADTPAGQAYYDALMRQYARWGVDLLKVDCIADHPYRPTEIRQLAEAIRKAGRPMVLSLSPGPSGVEHFAEMQRDAQMWRIADDLWDGWSLPAPGQTFPNGVRSAFTNLAKWAPYTGPNSWPDADMLPLGSLRPHPGWGDPRPSGLTADEARTAVTLWSVARSPLILGGDLTAMDAGERALLTNREILALNQREGGARPAPVALEATQVWLSTPAGATRPDTVAVFNLADRPREMTLAWVDLGLPARARPAARELWTGARLAPDAQARFRLPAHGAAVWRLEAAPR